MPRLQAPSLAGNATPAGYAYTSENRLAGTATVQLWHEPLGRMHQLYHYDGTTKRMTRFDVGRVAGSDRRQIRQIIAGIQIVQSRRKPKRSAGPCSGMAETRVSVPDRNS